MEGSSLELEEKLAARKQSSDELRQRGIIIGVGEEIREQLAGLADAGVQRVMLQWLDLDDLDGLKELARIIL